MKGVDAKAPEGRPPVFRSSGIIQAQSSAQFQRPLRPASAGYPTATPSHVCLFVRSEVFILQVLKQG